MSGPRRGRSRAAAELARAPVSLCPHCGRETHTVEGVCADCWGPKAAGARVPARPLRTESLFDWWSLDWLGLEGYLIWRGVLVLVALALGLWLGLR